MILSNHRAMPSLRFFGRMVDDIFAVIIGPFTQFREFIDMLVKYYPDMALNLQYSLHYSRYLDVHLYKALPEPDVTAFTIKSTLAWKTKQFLLCSPNQ